MNILKYSPYLGFLLLGCQNLTPQTSVNIQPVSIDYNTEPSLSRAPSNSTPFYSDAVYDENISTPENCLGFEVATRMAPGHAIIECFRTWAQESVRVQVETYAKSYEGRELVRVIISSEDNLKNLTTILDQLKQLAQPQDLSSSDLQAIISQTPAVGWFGYSIHGDETSGADASLVFGHYLIAGSDKHVQKIRQNTVIIIDPIMNPDGRARFLGRVEQSRSKVPNADYTSMHRGSWPYGRGNHYLFDLNRDWLTGSQPETRGRWANFRRYHPQLFVDVHEMQPTDTYLFSPKGQPLNPYFASTAQAWNRTFAKDQSQYFDKYRWTYYTREWSDNWYPGYASTWTPLQGAIGILHEQARYAGQNTRRPSGEIATYRDAVHHQAIGSLSNLTTLSTHRTEILRDYLAYHQANLRSAPETFVLLPSQNHSREQEFLSALIEQGIDVHITTKATQVRNAVSTLNQKYTSLKLPKGTYLVHARQARGALVKALLTFDPQFDDQALNRERKRIIREGRGGMYDVTTWNLGMAFDLNAYWINTPQVSTLKLSEPPRLSGAVKRSPKPVAWVIDSSDDNGLVFAIKAMEHGLKVYASNQNFDAAGRRFSRGSFLIRAVENRADALEKIPYIAEKSLTQVYAVSTGRSITSGPDLGGHHFELLTRPRVGILTNAPAAPSDYGHLWHWLDRRLGIPVTQLDMQTLGSYDLRRYNVLIAPPLRGSAAPLVNAVPQLRTWVQTGGTLIAIESSAEALADAKLNLTTTRRRRDILASLSLYQASIDRWFDGLNVSVDASSVWSQQTTPPPSSAISALKRSETPRPGNDARDAREAEDTWLRRFSPGGTMLRAYTDDMHWLTSGIGAELPVLTQGDLSLVAPESVRVPVRLAPAHELRLSGLLWPEARQRLAQSAWVTAETQGAGQIILFSSRPGFRSQHLGTGRLLSNAVVLGPGMGTQQPHP